MIVGQSMQHYQRIAVGLSIPASVSSGLVVTQGVWRFLANQHITTQLLVAPLRQLVQQQINGCYVLHVFDWCKLDYKNHVSKVDRISDCLKDNHGYDFTAQLAVNADNGSPIALVRAHMKTAAGFLSAMDKAPESGTNHLDQVLPMMQATPSMCLGGTPVAIIDREADSVFYFRQWHDAGTLFLVRADDDGLLNHCLMSGGAVSGCFYLSFAQFFGSHRFMPGVKLGTGFRYKITPTDSQASIP
ncbi:MAG: hypothetical protein LBU65_02800, partial [Planctomycetaceae bacterium]|nr:hypothetical protein [Planctomycetaceae bacterium]